MEADWEFEVGGGAPVIEAFWAGFVDLRRHLERMGEIHEAATFPSLAAMLEALNGARSPLWTAKCDLWEPEPDELASADPVAPQSSPALHTKLACYVDLLPIAGDVFAQRQAEAFCREWVARLAPFPLLECRVDLVIGQAIADDVEGFGVTAYLSAEGKDRSTAAESLATVLTAFVDTIPNFPAPGVLASKIQ